MSSNKNGFVLILKISWKDHINKEVRDKAGIEPLSGGDNLRRLKMIGHALRQERERNCNVTLAWAPERERKRGRTKTTWGRLYKTLNHFLITVL